MRRSPSSLKARALNYLAAREHSRLDLARKLTPYARDGDDVDALLDWLQESGFLSQQRFSESLVQRRAGRYGNDRILSELKHHGIDGEALGEVRRELMQSEVERACEVLRRKYVEVPADAGTRARCMHFLQQRGFSHHAIRQALRSAWRCAADEG
ncbi:MAG TPA: recombination regulator RecX [Herbaspirillum sp.]|nr:recombination regulator RecX [Herbaspirillum sp.]